MPRLPVCASYPSFVGLACGAAAQHRVVGHGEGSEDDAEKIVEVVLQEGFVDYVREIVVEADDLVARNWLAIGRVALALYERHRLTGR